MRYALYFTPSRDHPLTKAACCWLGRDAFTGKVQQQPPDTGLPPEDMARFTSSPRRYGFHATLKAPFRLVDGTSESDLVNALDAYAARIQPITIPQPVIAPLGGFHAIVPGDDQPELKDFAGQVVALFDKFRAPTTAEDLQRRKPDSLTEAQRHNLFNWGYPYAFDEFRFHMTLTGDLNSPDRERAAAALKTHFDPLLREALVIDRIAVFVEAERDGPFRVHREFMLAA